MFVALVIKSKLGAALHKSPIYDNSVKVNTFVVFDVHKYTIFVGV